jgi:hypothetical protein
MLKRVLVSGMLVLSAIGMAATAVAQVQVHGFVLARTIVTNNNYAERIDRYGVQFAQKIDDQFDWVAETYIHPTQTTNPAGRVYMESAYLNVHLKDQLPWDFNVRIGKGRNYCYGIAPTYGNRHTTDYSLYSEAFTQVRVLGFQTFSNFGKVQFAAALLNPNVISNRPVPDFPLGNSVNTPIADRDNDTGAVIQRVALSGRLGYKTMDAKNTSGVNIGASAYVTQNGADKIAGVKVKNNVTRFGLDGELRHECGLLLQGQFTIAQTPVSLDKDALNLNEKELSHNGFEAIGGYEKGKFGLLGRYGQLNYDEKLQSMNQIMLTAVYKARPFVHFRLEGLINGEEKKASKGFAEVKNNVLIFESTFMW